MTSHDLDTQTWRQSMRQRPARLYLASVTTTTGSQHVCLLNNYYKKYLGPHFTPQKEESATKSTWWLNSFLLPKDIDRDKFIQECKKYSLDIRPGFYMLNQMTCFENYSTISQSVSSIIYKRIICFPSFISISESGIKEISKIANRALGIS